MAWKVYALHKQGGGKRKKNYISVCVYLGDIHKAAG